MLLNQFGQAKLAGLQLYIMNVDSENYHEVREYIKEHKLLEKCEFISFDLEFTGIKFDNNERQRWDMFLNEKYQKMSSVATRFNIIQIGITFILPDAHQKYLAYPFNFYVFPRENFLSDPVISMQAGCVEFNSLQQMDWNRWIRKGINFVKITEFNKYLNPQKNKKFKELYDYLSLDSQVIVDDILSGLKQKKVDFQEKFQLPRLTAYQVKKVLDKFSEENELNYHISLPKQSPQDDKISEITIRIMSEKQHSVNEAARMENMIGFTLLFQQIWNSGKTFIGHNCLYDILFIFQTFIDSLPTEYLNFKKMVADNNRRFFDTKYIAMRLGEKQKIFNKGTSLEQIYRYYSDKDMEENLTLAPGFDSYDLKNPALHEAGFDSYLTAWVFFHLPRREEYEGRINSAKSFYCMNLRAESDEIRRDIMVFAVQVSVYNAFVPLDELKKMKIQHTKNIREQLLKEGVLQLVVVSDGLKQIFIATKDKDGNEVVCKAINRLKMEKRITNVMSLQTWIRIKNETQISRNKPVGEKKQL